MLCAFLFLIDEFLGCWGLCGIGDCERARVSSGLFEPDLES